MRAVVVDRWMEPAELCVSEVPEPELVPGSVKIATRAAALNFFDILMVKGEYQVKPPFPFIPGAELAGEVVAVGEGVERFRLGDRVLSSSGLGAFAEQVVIGEERCIAVPEGMDFAEAAALPIVYATSYLALVFRAGLQAGETLLVHAAAGGVGLAAVQIGRALGARVLATAGGAEKLAIAIREGADLGIDYRKEDFVARVKEETEGRGADVIYDPVGGDVFDSSLRCIAWNGRVLVVGFAGGQIPQLKVNRVLLKNIAVVGVNWGGHAGRQPQRVQATYDGLFDLYAKGKIRPVIFDRYPLERLPEALGALGSRATYGKLVVEF